MKINNLKFCLENSLFKKLRFIIFSLILIFIYFNTLYAQDILIFSTSHSNSNATVLTNPVGTLRIDISSFEKINSITVNNKPIKFNKKYRANLSIPYRLRIQKLKFNIQVKTEKSVTNKEFILVYEGIKPKSFKSKAEPSFKNATVFAMQSLDNVNNDTTTATNKSGSKLSLTITPSYNLKINNKNSLLFKAIILREKFNQDEFKNNGIVYDLFKLGWKKRNRSGDWQLLLGSYNINDQSPDVITGETGVEKGQNVTYLNNYKFSSTNLMNYKIKLNIKDVVEELSAQHDGDGIDLTLNFNWLPTFWGVSTGFKTEVVINDAKGEFRDFNSFGYGFSMSYTFLKRYILNYRFDSKQTNFTSSEVDSLKEAKEATTTLTTAYGFSYILSPKYGLILKAESKLNSQTSNVAYRQYNASFNTLSLIHVF